MQQLRRTDEKHPSSEEGRLAPTQRAHSAGEPIRAKSGPPVLPNRTALRHYGYLAENTRRIIAEHMTGGDADLMREVAEGIDRVRTDLLSQGDSPLETLLVERVLTCWLEVQYFDSLHAMNMNGIDPQEGDYFQRRQDRAHRRLLSAAKTLAVIRRLPIPAVQVNIGEKQVNVLPAGSQLMTGSPPVSHPEGTSPEIEASPGNGSEGYGNPQESSGSRGREPPR